MARDTITLARGWVAPVIVLAALAGAGAGVYYRFNALGVIAAPAAKAGAAAREPGTVSPVTDSAGLRYARAFQEGDWDYIIDHTLWMQDRLEYVRVSTGDPAAEATARDALAAELGQRSLTDAQLRSEGVEDRYVFMPGAEIAVAGIDAGRDDLERPAAARHWLRVTYPVRTHALRDWDGLPIRSLTVGVNFSADEMVLKAGIDGNIELQDGSISYDWGDAAPGA